MNWECIFWEPTLCAEFSQTWSRKKLSWVSSDLALLLSFYGFSMLCLIPAVDHCVKLLNMLFIKEWWPAFTDLIWVAIRNSYCYYHLDKGNGDRTVSEVNSNYDVVLSAWEIFHKTDISLAIVDFTWRNAFRNIFSKCRMKYFF